MHVKPTVSTYQMPWGFLKAVSDIVLVSGSDRSIQVFDMNQGKVAAELPDAHSRAVHCITQNKVNFTVDS